MSGRRGRRRRDWTDTFERIAELHAAGLSANRIQLELRVRRDVALRVCAVLRAAEESGRGERALLARPPQRAPGMVPQMPGRTAASATSAHAGVRAEMA